MYKSILLIFVILIVIIFYYVKIIVYKPFVVNENKYLKFYKNILKLTETSSNIINTYVITNDSIALDTLYLKNLDTDKCIIFFHGNSGNISMRYDMIKFLYTYASVLIFDYRGYGKSSGRRINISSSDLQNDAFTIWKYATKTLNILPSKICLFGESLGCSLAIYITCKVSQTHNVSNYPHSLVLNSPFYSITSLITCLSTKMSTFKFPLQVLSNIISRLTKNYYKSNEWISYINQHTNILIAHSINDEIIPYNEGKKLFDLISQTHPKSKFVDIIGSHNNLRLTDDYIYSLAEIFE